MMSVIEASIASRSLSAWRCSRSAASRLDTGERLVERHCIFLVRGLGDVDERAPDGQLDSGVLATTDRPEVRLVTGRAEREPHGCADVGLVPLAPLASHPNPTNQLP